jgi:hypothetical protein
MARGRHLGLDEVHGWTGTISREAVRGVRRQPKLYAAACTSGCGALTVFLAINHAPTTAFFVPIVMLVCAMLAGTRQR